MQVEESKVPAGEEVKLYRKRTTGVVPAAESRTSGASLQKLPSRRCVHNTPKENAEAKESKS